MAKFNEFITNETKPQKLIEVNGKKISVKQYLPINEKLKLIERVMALELNSNPNNFINPVQLEVLSAVEIVKAYTNIEFDEEISVDAIYDVLVTENIISQIKKAIPQEELSVLNVGIKDTIKSYYDYKTSVLGILEAVNTDYSNLEFDADKIKNDLADPDNLALLKGVMDKLG